MKTIEILEREHTWIGWMAESLETLVAHAKVKDVLPPAAYELLSLYETFADGRHQDKEEQVLFPELLSAADDEERELLGKLLTDHTAERRYMSGMRVNVLGAMHAEPGSLREFVREAAEYLDLHHAHMARENETLLPMATRLLSPEADERVQRGFETLEGGAGDPHALREQIMSLHQRVGLPRPPAA